MLSYNRHCTKKPQSQRAGKQRLQKYSESALWWTESSTLRTYLKIWPPSLQTWHVPRWAPFPGLPLWCTSLSFPTAAMQPSLGPAQTPYRLFRLRCWFWLPHKLVFQLPPDHSRYPSVKHGQPHLHRPGSLCNFTPFLAKNPWLQVFISNYMYG